MILSTLFSFRDFLCLDDLVMNPFVAGFFGPSGLCEALFASFWVVYFSVCWGYCEFLKHVVVDLLVFFILKPLACREQAT